MDPIAAELALAETAATKRQVDRLVRTAMAVPLATAVAELAHAAARPVSVPLLEQAAKSMLSIVVAPTVSAVRRLTDSVDGMSVMLRSSMSLDR